MKLKESNLFRVIQWWVGSNLPIQHIFISSEKRPKELKSILRVYFRKWFIHPIKRRIAKYYLVFLRKNFNLKVIGITGSAGKTTTKEMLASILKQRGKTVASFANIDPVYNIPTTILKCRPSTKYLVLEFGVEYPGELDFYLWLAKPDIGIITNIYPTHTLFFGDEKGVLKEKGKLVKALNKDGVAILNKENKYLREISREINSKIIWFGEGGEIFSKNQKITNDFNTQFTLFDKNAKTSVQIPTVGKQFVDNSLASAAAALSLGFTLNEVRSGLEDYKKPEHRMRVIKLKNGSVLIDDSYNSNPSAVKEALKTFKIIVGDKKSIVVFGDMLELGQDEVKYHKEIGKIINSYKFDYLIGVGSLTKNVVSEAKSKNSFWVASQDGVLEILKPLLTRNSIVLIKGSRSIGLDKIITQLS